LGVVALITVLSGAFAVIVPYLPHNAGTTISTDNLWTIAKLGFGAIVGLLGGKAV
jgi:hypothetical protein